MNLLHEPVTLERRAAVAAGETASDGIPAIAFAPSKPLTLGIEIELQLIDPRTHDLTPRAVELLRACSSMQRVKAEFFQSTIEVLTDVCSTVHDAAATLAQDMHRVAGFAAALEIAIATTGCHPFARYAEVEITPTSRYHDLTERHQWLIRRMAVYGLHVHLGVPSGEDCIRLHNAFLRYIPHLIALSASSPFWQGLDTGLVASRPTIYESLPTAGRPYALRDWREFETICHALTKSQSIGSLKDLWWDLRPSPGFGTLEVRVCDGAATLAEALAFAAFIHLLAHAMCDRCGRAASVAPPEPWLVRENKWRAIRHGLEADILVDGRGNTAPVRAEIAGLLDELAPHIEALGYHPYVATISAILEKGNSSARQRAVFDRSGSLEDVVRFNALEFRGGRPSW